MVLAFKANSPRIRLVDILPLLSICIRRQIRKMVFRVSVYAFVCVALAAQSSAFKPFQNTVDPVS